MFRLQNNNIQLGKNFNINLPLEPEQKPLVMLWVKPGTFNMGYSPDPNFLKSDDSFEMTLSTGYWLGKYPVTQAQWLAIMENDPSHFKGQNLPVESINWHEALKFCQKMNQIYNNNLPNNYKFSLPTEAQWEYACRAGTTSINYEGNEPKDVFYIAWCQENSNNTTHEVGLKKPNRWGFYDMFGNVTEWCFDTVTYYPKGRAIDWIGQNETADEEESKIYRGGAYCDESDFEIFDSAFRSYISFNDKDKWCGFRLCLRVLS